MGTPLASEERPILLVVPSRAQVAEAFRAVLSHEEVRAWAMQPVWNVWWDGVDVLNGCRDVANLDLRNLDEVIGYLLRAATPEIMRRNVAREWEEVGNHVREFFLKRSTLAIFGGIFKLGRPTSAYEPAPQFVSDCIHEARFEAQYRLCVVPGAAARGIAPPEEASLVFYPFDPENAEARAEAGLHAEGREAILEAFCYAEGRDRHRAHLRSVASARGWRVVDPFTTAADGSTR